MAPGLYDITPLESLIEQGYTLLTPNFRLARRIKAEWDARQLASGKGTWEPAPVLPLESWLQQQWELAVSNGLLPPVVPLTAAQSVEVWRQVISQQQSHSPEFQLLKPSGAAELAAAARDSLVRWQVDWRTAGNKALFQLEGDCCTFLQWLELFEDRLQRDGFCTEVDCLAHLPGLKGSLREARVALVEFELIPPLLRAALESLCSDVRDVSPPSDCADRLVHSFNDKRSELQAVASWAANIHRVGSGTTTAIVLSEMASDRVPLEYLLRREFDCLGHNYASLPVNFSTGITLDKAPLVRDALAALAMGLQECTIAAVEGLQRSRFLNLPDAQGALAQRFIRQLYAQGRAVVSVSDIRNEAQSVQLGDAKGLLLVECLDALRATPGLRRKALPSAWRTRFSDILVAWGWPGTQGLDSLEYQQLALWHRTLDEFETFDLVSGPLHFGEALALLRGCCSRQVSQPQTADSPVQVLGPLEAAGLKFDQLWLVGVQGANWPAPPRPNPFIPLALQTRLQMPHASPEREWAFAEALLKQYERSSAVMHASYCRQIDGIPDLPSSLVQDYRDQALTALPLVEAKWLAHHSAASLEEVVDDRAPPLDLSEPRAIKGGSALLEDQSQCPFRAFARHRLQVEPLPAFSVALSPADRGSLLHHALHNLWGDLRDYATLQALDAAREEHSVKRAVQAAIAGIPNYRQRKYGSAFWRLEEARLSAVLREWLQLERQRGDFVVEAREQDMTLELSQLQIRLRVDRVDVLPDGSRVIIDYKTGRSSVQDWMGERPARPQLLLYSIAAPETVASLTFATVRPRECRFSGLGTIAAAPGIATTLPGASKSALDAKAWSELNEHWKNTLEKLAGDYVQGEAHVDPLTPSSCIWCGLQPLCRIESGAGETEQAIEETTQ